MSVNAIPIRAVLLTERCVSKEVRLGLAELRRVLVIASLRPRERSGIAHITCSIPVAVLLVWVGRGGAVVACVRNSIAVAIRGAEGQRLPVRPRNILRCLIRRQAPETRSVLSRHDPNGESGRWSMSRKHQPTAVRGKSWKQHLSEWVDLPYDAASIGVGDVATGEHNETSIRRPVGMTPRRNTCPVRSVRSDGVRPYASERRRNVVECNSRAVRGPSGKEIRGTLLAVGGQSERGRSIGFGSDKVDEGCGARRVRRSDTDLIDEPRSVGRPRRVRTLKSAQERTARSHHGSVCRDPRPVGRPGRVAASRDELLVRAVRIDGKETLLAELESDLAVRTWKCRLSPRRHAQHNERGQRSSHCGSPSYLTNGHCGPLSILDQANLTGVWIESPGAGRINHKINAPAVR